MKIILQIFICCLVFGYMSAVPTSAPPPLFAIENNENINTVNRDPKTGLTNNTSDVTSPPSTTSPKVTTTSVTTVRTTTLSPEQKCYQYCANITNDLKQQYDTEIDKLKNIVINLMENRCELNKGKWVSAENGTIPKGGIVSGWDPDRPYWVARASTGCSIVPCKLTKVHATCWMAWNNTEIRMNKYEVLVDADVKWVQHSSNNPLPEKALIAGHYLNSEGISEKLYVGRAFIAEFLVPGYVYEFSRQLRHSTKFKNEMKTSYEILVNL